MSDPTPRMTLGRMQNPVRGLLHGTAVVVGAVLLLTPSAGRVSKRVAMLAVGASLVGLDTISSLYHSVAWRPLWKQRLQRVFAYHEVFHVLVVAGSASHWAMTFACIAPLMPLALP